MRWLKSKLAELFRQNRFTDDSYPDDSVRRTFIGTTLLDVLLFPIRLLFFPFRILGVFHNDGVQLDEYEENTSLTERLARIGKTLIWLPFWLLYTPIKFIGLLRNANRREALYILPALMMIGFFGFVFVQVFARGDVIKNRYEKGARDAVAAKDLALAKTYYQRLVSSGTFTRAQQLQWTTILLNTGETERGEELLNQLAPDTELGYGPAHRIKAISFARHLRKSKDPKVLRKLRWHLQNCHDQSPQIQQAWAVYYLGVEQYDDAVAALDKAAVTDPNYYQLIASIYKSQGRNSESKAALNKAANEFKKLLEKDRLNHRARVSYANALVQMEQHDEAKAILLQGNRIQPDAIIKRALSEFYVQQHNRAQKNGLNAAAQMKYLTDAINFDPYYAPAYSQMMRLFHDGTVSDESTQVIRTTFQNIVASDNPTPWAHLALSNILWREGKKDQAQFHLERAYALEKKIVIVLNNLAWMIAHSEDPDLERARELAETAVKQTPENLQARDTLGTIYLMLGRNRDAVGELEKALPGSSDKKATHKKLATAYKNLEMEDLSKIHAQQSK